MISLTLLSVASLISTLSVAISTVTVVRFGTVMLSDLIASVSVPAFPIVVSPEILRSPVIPAFPLIESEFPP